MALADSIREVPVEPQAGPQGGREFYLWMSATLVMAMITLFAISYAIAPRPASALGMGAGGFGIGVEYRVSGEFIQSKMEESLNALAAEGWEVVQVLPAQCRESEARTFFAIARRQAPG